MTDAKKRENNEAAMIEAVNNLKTKNENNKIQKGTRYKLSLVIIDHYGINHPLHCL